MGIYETSYRQKQGGRIIVMTTVYFIRHAQSDRFHHDDRTRPLTAEGLSDTHKVSELLKNAGIQHIISSPYKRTVQTVQSLSDETGIEIEMCEMLRERNAGVWHGDNFIDFIRQQWEDRNYHAEGGESLSQVQERCIGALNEILDRYKGQTIALSTHGTALSVMLDHYSDFGFRGFMRIIDFMPYVVKIVFSEDKKPLSSEEVLVIKKEYK